METGFNIQSSRYDSPIEVLEGLPPTKDFLRTPNQYGFATLKFMPGQKFNTNLNYVCTGPMKLLHFAGAPEQDFDALVNSEAFSELGFKARANSSTNVQRLVIDYGTIEKGAT